MGWLVAAAGLLGAAIVGLAGFLVFYNSDSQVYARNLREADKYMSILRYEDAILCYESAISAMPDRDEAYLKLADVYFMLGDMTSAVSTLEQGMLFSDSGRLPVMLEGVATAASGKGSTRILALQKGDFGGGSATSPISNSSDTVFDDQMFVIFGQYNYGDYRRSYGEPSWSSWEGGLKGSWEGMMTLYYYDTSENPDVINETQGVPHTYSKPTEIELDNIGVLFRNYEGSLSADRIEELCGKRLEVTHDAENDRYYFDLQYGGCRIQIESDQDGNIVGTDVWNRIRPEDYGTGEEEGSAPSISGYVIDASTGKGIYGAVLSYKQNGAEVKSLFSEGDGSYKTDLQPGVYEVEVSYGNYITENYHLEVRTGENQYNVNYTLSSNLNEGALRIVLEWGSRPYDLDSYVSGTLSDGTPFFVNFMNPVFTIGGKVIAELDVDDTNGFGPETITVYDPGASFDYFIVDFRSEGLQDFTGVSVKLYLPGETMPAVYAGKMQDFGIKEWIVFHYDGGTVSTIDRYPQELSAGSAVG